MKKLQSFDLSANRQSRCRARCARQESGACFESRQRRARRALQGLSTALHSQARSLSRTAAYLTLIMLPVLGAIDNAAAQDISSYACAHVTHSGTDYSGRSLVGEDFAGKSLVNANFSGSDVSGANFEGADLTGADFTGATLAQGPEAQEMSDFTSATLTNACFNAVSIKGSPSAPGASFQFANLNCTAITQTDITAALFGPSIRAATPGGNCRSSFAGTLMNCEFLAQWKDLDLSYANVAVCKDKLAGLDLSDALMSGVQFQYMNLAATNFTGATLDQTNLYSADLTGALFNGANLKLATLSSVQAKNAQFKNQAQLSGATLSYGNFQEAFFNGAVLQAADGIPAATLSFAVLENADFSGAEMIGVNMSGATLDQATLIKSATIQNANFSNATLSNIKLQSAKLSGVVFDYADLIDADFTGATFLAGDNYRAASLVKANLQGADFTQSNLDGVNMTNAAVALADGVPLFAIGSDVSGLTGDLNSGNLTAELNNAFEQNGYALQYCTSPQLSVLNSGHRWNIRIHGLVPKSGYSDYLLISQTGGVSVSGVSTRNGGSITHLFDIAGDFTDALNNGEIPRAVFAGFTDNQQALPRCSDPSIAATRSQSYWTLTTNQVSATAPVVGYTGFRINPRQDQTLKVYGTVVMTVYQGPDGRLTWTPFSVQQTQIDVNYLSDQTVCPNGATYGANQQAGVSFEDMMTAPAPPAPPACAPGSGMCK